MPAPVVAAAAPAALPWLGGALAGGGALIGSIASGMFGSSQVSRQMGFQERMSSTAHQREMEDMRRAGLNPLLSARHGGAAAPSGAAAQAPDFAGSVNSALAASRLSMDKEMQAAQINDVNSAAALKQAQTNDVYATQADRIDLMIAQRQKTLEDEKVGFSTRKKMLAEIDVLRAQRDNIRANTASTMADSEKKKLIGKAYGVGNRAVDWVTDKLRSIPRGGVKGAKGRNWVPYEARERR